MRKNLDCLLLSLLLVLSAFALSASADPSQWKTPWRDNSVYVTQLPTAAHSTSGSNAAWDFGTSGVSYPLYAPFEIENVLLSGWDNSGYGYMVKLLLKDGYTVLIAHLAEPSPLVKGQTNLSQDTYFGRVGATGAATGVHIHYEVYIDRQFASSLSLFGYDSASWTIGTVVPSNAQAPSEGGTNPPVEDEPSNPGGGDDLNLPGNLVTFCNASSGMTSGKDPGEWNVSVGVGDVSRASEMPFPNDQLSGIYINVDNLIVELFTDDGFSGQSIVLDKKGFHSLAQGSGLDFDNRTSSFKVYFKDQKIISNPPTSPVNPVTDEYEVSSVSVGPAGNLVMTIRNENTGAIISPTWTWANGENSFLVKVPDNCTFYIDPAYNVIALDTDPSFASGSGGELFANGQYTGIKYFPGSTVRFGPHTAPTSFTIWIEPSSSDGSDPGTNDPGVNPPVVNLPVIPNPPIIPSDPGNPGEDNYEDDDQTSGENPTAPDDDYTSKHKVDVSLDGGGGGGCSTGSSGALLGIAFTAAAASVRKRR